MPLIIEGGKILQGHRGRSDYFGPGGLEIEVFSGTTELLKEKFTWQRSGKNFKSREQQEHRYQSMKEHNADTPFL